MLYRNWRYEQELDSLLWKIDFKEVQIHESDKDGNEKKQTRVSANDKYLNGLERYSYKQLFIFGCQSTHPLVRTSQVSLSSNPDTDFRYSTIFTPIGLYKGQLHAIKKVKKKYIDITREMKMELKLVSGKE